MDEVRSDDDLLFTTAPSVADRLLGSADALEQRVRALGRRLIRGEPAAPGRPRRHRPPASPGAAPVVLFAALPWDFRFQRPQQLALALAAAGVPVLYLEAFRRSRLEARWRRRRRAPGVTGLHLRLAGRRDLYRRPLPAVEGSQLAALLAAGLARPPRAVVAQLPGWGCAARALATALGVPLLYDRIDLHTAFPGVGAAVAAAEAELVAAAHLVTATAPDLARRSREQGARRVELLPNAVALADLPLLPRPSGPPAAGLVGALDQRLDTAALAALAAARPDLGLHLAGRVEAPEVAALGEHSNLHLHGEVPYAHLPRLLGRLHVGLLPYRDTPQTRAVDAVKVYEMLAAGLPVVARRLPGTAHLEAPLVYLYDDGDELPQLLARALAEDDDGLRRRRRESVAGATWRSRAASLLGWIDELAAGGPEPGEDAFSPPAAR